MASEEYKQMQNLLKPIELDRARQQKGDKYVTNQAKKEDLTKYPIQDMASTGKQPFSQSSGFSSFDKFSLRTQPLNIPLRIDQMVTLSVYNSTSGTIKKMLHGPSLKIYCVKEVPLANRETREIIKKWISVWET